VKESATKLVRESIIPAFGRVRALLTEKALGEHFSMPQFHNWLLQTGTVPLDVLKQVIDEVLPPPGGRRPR